MKGALLTDKQKGYGGYGFISYPPFSACFEGDHVIARSVPHSVQGLIRRGLPLSTKVDTFLMNPGRCLYQKSWYRYVGAFFISLSTKVNLTELRKEVYT